MKSMGTEFGRDGNFQVSQYGWCPDSMFGLVRMLARITSYPIL